MLYVHLRHSCNQVSVCYTLRCVLCAHACVMDECIDERKRAESMWNVIDISVGLQCSLDPLHLLLCIADV